MAPEEIIAAADGSALGNPGPAGWAWYINDDCWGAGGWKHGTNNMGELKAVLDLLESTAHVPERPLKILCDSKYTIDSLTKWIHGWKKKGWKKSDGKPVLNLELFKELDAALAGRTYTFEWVKGHAGHPMNEAADERARAAALAYKLGKNPPAGPGFTLGEGKDEPKKPTSTEALEESALDAETMLLDQTIFTDEERLQSMLAEGFCWITPAGAVIDRETVLEFRDKAFRTEETPEILAQEEIAPQAVRILSKVKTPRVRVLRTSLWKQTHAGWVLTFRQETAQPLSQQ